MDLNFKCTEIFEIGWKKTMDYNIKSAWQLTCRMLKSLHL